MIVAPGLGGVVEVRRPVVAPAEGRVVLEADRHPRRAEGRSRCRGGQHEQAAEDEAGACHMGGGSTGEPSPPYRDCADGRAATNRPLTGLGFTRRLTGAAVA